MPEYTADVASSERNIEYSSPRAHVGAVGCAIVGKRAVRAMTAWDSGSSGFHATRGGMGSNTGQRMANAASGPT